MKSFTLALAFLLLTATAYAADVDGKWSGTVQGPMGDFPVAFTFKADGAKLTGSTTGFDGAEVPIMVEVVPDRMRTGSATELLGQHDGYGLPGELLIPHRLS